MRYRMDILLAGRSGEELQALEALLSGRSDLRITTRVLVNGHSDPLYEISPLPDALVLAVSHNWAAELAALSQRPADARPPLLVVGEAGNAELIRVAMRAGARDFLSPPVDSAELEPFLGQLLRDKRSEPGRKTARLTAVINAKGGSGASMVACNLAHALAGAVGRHALLVDMDVQFGGLPFYFNLAPRNGLVRALELVDSLDLLALEGYVLPHHSGLDLLASTAEDRLTMDEIPEERVEMLLAILGEAYEDIVVDLPRWITGATAAVLERADHVLVVMEPGITHLRDAQQLIAVLRGELRVADAQLSVVVNRFQKNGPLSMKDLAGALPGPRVVTLPNDAKRVSHSINVGSPLPESAPGAPITRELEAMARALGSGGAPLHGRPPSRWNPLTWAR